MLRNDKLEEDVLNTCERFQTQQTRLGGKFGKCGDGDLYKSGRTGQGLYISPETDTVVVWYSSAYKAEIWIHQYAREIVGQLFR